MNTGDVLRGIAILSVLVNHYVNAYLSEEFIGMANGMVALFFALSGHYVAKQLLRKDSVHWKYFFVRRFSAIYPLFLICILFETITGGREFDLTAYLGLDSPSIYWFVSAIIHCYLATPLLVRAFRGRSPMTNIIWLGGGILTLNLLLIFIESYQSFPFYRTPFVYRNIFLGHILIYGIAMALTGSSAVKRLPAVGYGSAFVALAAVFLTRSSHGVFPDILNGMMLCFGMAFAVSFFVVKKSNSRMVVPLVWLGQISYPLYLLHTNYYAALHAVGLLEYGSFLSVVYTILLFPVFVAMCVGTDRLMVLCARGVRRGFLGVG